MGVLEILRSFRLILKRKTCKEIPELSWLDFLKFSANNFARYSRYAFVENNIGDLPKVPRAKILESDRFFRFISKCKFGSFKNPLDYFRFSRLNLLVQAKKLISMSYGSLKEGVLKKQSMPNFPKNKHFLPPTWYAHVHKLCYLRDIPFSVWRKVNGNWENNIIRISW